MEINIPQSKEDFIKAKYGNTRIIQQVVDSWLDREIEKDYQKKSMSTTIDAKLEFIRESKSNKK